MSAGASSADGVEGVAGGGSSASLSAAYALTDFTSLRKHVEGVDFSATVTLSSELPRRLERRAASMPGPRSWLRAAIGPFKGGSSNAAVPPPFEVRICCGDAQWVVSKPYKAFVAVDAQLRGNADPSPQPPLATAHLPELPSARGGGDARHLARVSALQAWVPAVLRAVQSGELQAHPPLSVLLELQTPLVVLVQSHTRTFLADKRTASPKDTT